MFEGDMVEGELEIGQISAYIDAMKPAGDIVREIVERVQSSEWSTRRNATLTHEKLTWKTQIQSIHLLITPQ
jgi:hypothetical protein